MPPWNLENIDIFRSTEPKDGIRDESYWTNHAEDLSVLMYDAQGVPVPWTGTTRFELVLQLNIFKENGRNYMLERLKRQTQYQKTTRPPDCLPEYWATIGQHKQRQEIVKWQQRKNEIDELLRNAVFFVFLLTLLNMLSLPHLCNIIHPSLGMTTKTIPFLF